jgi:hypothetical protein
MPRYFQAWERGLPELKAQLKTVDEQRDYGFYKKKPRLKQMMQERGYSPDAKVTLLMTGQSPSMLVVFDPVSLRIKDYLRSDFGAPSVPKAKPPK